MRIIGSVVIAERMSLIKHELSFYNELDPEFRPDRDELLQVRSAYELQRERLSDDQRAELDKVDAYWRANAEAFNRAFNTFHYQTDRKTVLNNFANNDDGTPIAVPNDHWWWRPL